MHTQDKFLHPDAQEACDKTPLLTSFPPTLFVLKKAVQNPLKSKRFHFPLAEVEEEERYLPLFEEMVLHNQAQVPYISKLKKVHLQQQDLAKFYANLILLGEYRYSLKEYCCFY